MYQRFLKDKWFGKTLFYPEWVEDAINNSSEIFNYYKTAPMMKETIPGNGPNWRIMLESVSPISSYIPKVAEWLDKNNASISYWTINQPDDISPEYKEELSYIKKDVRDSLSIHSDFFKQAEELEEWDRSPESDKVPFPKISLNIPLDSNEGFDSVRVYSFGNPPAVQRNFGDYVGEELPLDHGFFHKDDVKLEYIENNPSKLPVLINICQPHSFIISSKTPKKRLALRLRVKDTYREDPWHLLEE